MSNRRPVDLNNLTSRFAVQIPPLGQADLLSVQAAMAEAAPDWLVELHGICSSEATLVLIPDSGDDASGPSFLISRDTYGLRVDQVHWDTLTELGIYASLSDVIFVLRLQLASHGDWGVPASATIH